jgi:hypothetical protein
VIDLAIETGDEPSNPRVGGEENDELGASQERQVLVPTVSLAADMLGEGAVLLVSR